MIIIDEILVSDDLHEVCFACNLKKCKGACCVEGDAGAPLEDIEIGEIEDAMEHIKPFMTEAGSQVIENSGVFDYDMDGNYVTPLVNDCECAFVYFEDGIAHCAIEKAWFEKLITFRKPVSCHLYPIRIVKRDNFEALNYHKWEICEAALINGNREKIPVYVFEKDALIRKYGLAWYNKLKNEVERNSKRQ